MEVWLLLAAIVVLAVLYVALPVGLAMRAHFARPRAIRCPMERVDAAVEVRGAGLAEALGWRSLRTVGSCSLWPRRQGCRQHCLAAPDESFRELPLRTP